MTFQDVVETVLKLSPEEQTQLIEMIEFARQPSIQSHDSDEPLMTSEEIEALLHGTPKNSQDIARSDYVGAWSDMGITDGAEWVNEQKRKRRERKSW